MKLKIYYISIPKLVRLLDLIGQLGGAGFVLGKLFIMYTELFLVPATKRAQDLLVETGFKRLLSPGVDPLVNSLKNRSANGAFGKSVHESFLSANIVELRMFHNVELGAVHAIVAFLSGSEGAAGWAHGGVVAAVADMFLARTSLILFGAAVTNRVTVHYHSPVPLLAICSLVALSESNPAVTRARATDEDGVVLFECEGTFFPRNKL